MKKGGVGVLATDTIYGLAGSALAPATVERIYKLRCRNFKKPMIVLISSLDDLKLFKIKLNKREREVAAKLWPGKVSIILNCPYPEFKYLHRGANTVAFRFPKKIDLVGLISKTGPLVAPSANLEGKEPAKTIEEARVYFGDQIDFYLDEGRILGLPSTLVAIRNGKLAVKRNGEINVIE